MNLIEEARIACMQSSDYQLDCFLKRIQLDAFKAGMTEAAKIVNEQVSHRFCEEAILTARDNKTII